MRLLAIETSSPRLSLAAGDESKVLAEFNGPLAWRHAESLFGGMKDLLKKVRWTPASLTGIAVSVGPGSFTGIRIGLAAARALGQTLEVPVVGVNALETLAAGQSTKDRWICPLLDALRGGVFAALYEQTPKGLRCRIKPVLVEAFAWRSQLAKAVGKEKVTLAGDAVALYGNSLAEACAIRKSPAAQWTPTARVLLHQARLPLTRAGKRSFETVVPLYLREAAAVERRKAR